MEIPKLALLCFHAEEWRALPTPGADNATTRTAGTVLTLLSAAPFCLDREALDVDKQCARLLPIATRGRRLVALVFEFPAISKHTGQHRGRNCCSAQSVSPGKEAGSSHAKSTRKLGFRGASYLVYAAAQLYGRKGRGT